MLKNIIIMLAPVLLFSCSQNNDHKTNTETRFLGHRGSGKGIETNYQENTIPSIKNAFDKLHGAEVDIQCSKDSTIWLFHNADLPENEQELLCIPSSRDAELETLANKDTSFMLNKLEEVFKLMRQEKTTPVLSLDVKGHFPNECFQSDNAPDYYFEMIVNSLINLLKDYDLCNYVMVETNYQYLLDKIKDAEPQIECYYLGYENFQKTMETTLKKSYDGISYNFHDEGLTKKDIENAKRAGLKIQLWSLYAKEDIRKAISWHPDFIQTGLKNLSENYLSDIIETNSNN